MPKPFRDEVHSAVLQAVGAFDICFNSGQVKGAPEQLSTCGQALGDLRTIDSVSFFG